MSNDERCSIPSFSFKYPGGSSNFGGSASFGGVSSLGGSPSYGGVSSLGGSPSHGGSSKYGGSSNYGGSSKYGGSSNYGGPSNHGPNYDSGSSSPSYDDESDEGEGPKVITSTKTVTTNSAQDTGYDQLNQGSGGQGQGYRQPSDSLGDIRFKLGDYLKDAPGHEGSMKFHQKLFQGRF